MRFSVFLCCLALCQSYRRRQYRLKQSGSFLGNEGGSERSESSGSDDDKTYLYKGSKKEYCEKFSVNYEYYCKGPIENAEIFTKFCPSYKKACVREQRPENPFAASKGQIKSSASGGGDTDFPDIEHPTESKRPSGRRRQKKIKKRPCSADCDERIFPHCTKECKCDYDYPAVQKFCNPPPLPMFLNTCRLWYYGCPKYEQYHYASQFIYSKAEKGKVLEGPKTQTQFQLLAPSGETLPYKPAARRRVRRDVDMVFWPEELSIFGNDTVEFSTDKDSDKNDFGTKSLENPESKSDDFGKKVGENGRKIINHVSQNHTITDNEKTNFDAKNHKNEGNMAESQRTSTIEKVDFGSQNDEKFGNSTAPSSSGASDITNTTDNPENTDKIIKLKNGTTVHLVAAPPLPKQGSAKDQVLKDPMSSPPPPNLPRTKKTTGGTAVPVYSDSVFSNALAQYNSLTDSRGILHRPRSRSPFTKPGLWEPNPDDPHNRDHANKYYYRPESVNVDWLQGQLAWGAHWAVPAAGVGGTDGFSALHFPSIGSFLNIPDDYD